MCSKCVDANSHIAFVVCVSSDKSVVTPLLILLGKRLNRDAIEGFNIEVHNIKTSPNGFINYTLFLRWI